MTILDPEALNAAVRDLNKQIGDAQQKLAAYESRKVPLSEADAARIFHAHPVESDGPSALAVARAALVAAESPAAVEAALAVWNDAPWWNRQGGMLAAIRAAHDAAIDGGCGAARESDGPPWLADAAEALGQVAPDGTPLALNWTQVIREIRDLRRCFGAEVEYHKLTAADRDKWIAEANRFEKESDAYKKAKAENDERFMGERDDARRECDDLRRQLDDALKTVNMQRVDLVSAQDRLDALTRPIDGVEELVRHGLVECGRGLAAIGRCEHVQAQAIASRVIGALRAALVRIENDSVDTMNPTAIFDAAVASLKIEPAKVEPKREADDAEQIDTRPVVKVGQVWTFDGNTEGPYTVGLIYRDYARTSKGEQFMRVAADGTPSHDGWRLISNTPTPKREPFELPKVVQHE